ncbi:MAG: ATP-binding protein [Hyphomicrobiales bacterium]
MSNDAIKALNDKLDGLIALIERAVPPKTPPFDADCADAFIWRAEDGFLQPIQAINRVDLDLLVGIDLVRDKFVKNTEQFADGYAANNVLMWGARGMGKSSLVKAVHRDINDTLENNHASHRLKLIEIHREDIDSLPSLMRLLDGNPHRFIVFCDDLSFDGDDASYKSLKSALDGGVEGRPDNVIFYATSNRRHLIPRDMMENERSTAINPSEAIEEKVSLSDRFGLWLGFHKCTQDDYLNMIEGYIKRYNLEIEEELWRFEALEWAKTRGNRSGRVAWQFIQDLAGRLGKTIKLD